VRYATEGLDVVHHSGFTEQTHDHRERRFRPWICPLAFQRIQQCGFLAADVAASAEMEVKLQAVAGSKNVFTEVATIVGFLYRSRETFGSQRVFAAEKDK